MFIEFSFLEFKWIKKFYGSSTSYHANLNLGKRNAIRQVDSRKREREREREREHISAELRYQVFGSVESTCDAMTASQ